MVATLVILALGAGVALLRGGRLTHKLPFRYVWLPIVALTVQLLTFAFPTAGLARFLVLLSYAGLAYFLIANWQYQSLRIIFLGVMLNALVIGANGGRIPVDVEAARIAGVETASLEADTDPKHVALVPGSRFAFLGDVIPVPGPIHKVMSIGDIAILVGIFLLIQDLMGKPIVLGFRPNGQG